MKVPTSTPVTFAASGKLPKKATHVVLVPADGEPVGAEHSEAVAALRDAGLFEAKPKTTATAVADGQPLLVVGLGGDEVSYREAGAAAGKQLRKLKATAAVLHLGDLDAAAVEQVVNGIGLACFDFAEYRGKAAEGEAMAKLKVTCVTGEKAAVKRGAALAEAQNFARTVASRPGNDLYPEALAEVARDLAAGSERLTCKVMDEKKLAKMKAGGILAVGQGSSRPPRLIVLEYKPKKKSKLAPLLVVGKSITFDTGGISIKPAANMGQMIFDKCGGMAVLGLMHAVAALEPDRPVVGLLSAAENMPGGNAYRPGDILTMYNGVTVEVTNTDAEGRLVLADAISWGCETYEPQACVNLATLTGGCVVALGELRAGAWSNDDELWEQVRSASGRADEPLWRMPLGDDFKEQLRAANSADIVNSPGRWGSPCTAGQFLHHFVPDGQPWTHLDIAGPAETSRELPLYAKGATGFAVRTLVEWVENCD